ncbi:MAG TPA: FtsX-like permease family protein, partial [Gemmatimonadaceae bacterium]|nr:FtsX-like permease family protein [Gemmatimonadaceae bacterium]
GRDFPSGTPPRPEVIIDQHTARGLWPGLEPVGREIKLGNAKSNDPWLTVVGVIKDPSDVNRLYSESVTPAVGEWRIGTIYYLPGAADSSIRSSKRGWTVDVAVRSRTDFERIPIVLKRTLQHVPNLRWVTASSMEEALGIRWQRQSHDFVAATFVSFATLALCLAALGVYGIVAHSVAERRRELGVRLALGASARDILHAVLREGNAVALSGVALGLIFSRLTVGWLAAFSFEDEKHDALLFAVMAAFLFGAAALAALLPAMRATRIDPVESLRSE